MYLGIVVGLERVHMLWGVALCTRVQYMCNVVELPRRRVQSYIGAGNAVSSVRNVEQGLWLTEFV